MEVEDEENWGEMLQQKRWFCVACEAPTTHRDGEPGEARKRHSSRLISILGFILPPWRWVDKKWYYSLHKHIKRKSDSNLCCLSENIICSFEKKTALIIMNSGSVGRLRPSPWSRFLFLYFKVLLYCLNLTVGKQFPVSCMLVKQQKDISLINGAGFLHLLVAQLKVDVRVPGLLFRLPFHPSLKDLPAAGDVSQHLLHVGVLVPVQRNSIQNITHRRFNKNRQQMHSIDSPSELYNHKQTHTHTRCTFQSLKHIVYVRLHLSYSIVR